MKTIRNIWKIEIKQLEKMKLKMVPKKRCNKSGFGGCPNLRVSRFGSWRTSWHSGKRVAWWLLPPWPCTKYLGDQASASRRSTECRDLKQCREGGSQPENQKPLHLTQQSIRNPSKPWEVGSSNRHSTPGKLTWNLKWEVTHRAKNCLSISTWQKLKSNDTGKGKQVLLY